MDIIYFALSAAAGLIGWFTIFSTIIWPRVQNRPKKYTLQVLTSIHFFRYFGTTMLITGLVTQKLPAGFANPAAFGDLIALGLAYVTFITLQRSRDDNASPLSVWLFNGIGAADLLLAAVLGPALIKDPANFGFAYFIPTFYVPLLLAAHFYSFKLLLRPAKVMTNSNKRQ